MLHNLHLVEGFVRFFDGGFDSEDYEKRERGYKQTAALLLKHLPHATRILATIANTSLRPSSIQAHNYLFTWRRRPGS
jgi:hypothetical protein